MLQAKHTEWHIGLKKNKEKARVYNMLPTRDPLQGKGHTYIKSDKMEKDVLNRNEMRSQVSVLMSDKIDFKTKPIRKDKEGHYIIK